MSVYNRKFLIIYLISSSLSLTCSLEGPIVTEQNTPTLTLPALIVQILTEPENLIRIFESLDLGLQMFRSWGKSGAALISLPLNKDILRGGYDPFTLGPHDKFYYTRVPTINSHEAPRFIKMTQEGTQENFNINPIHRLFLKKEDAVKSPFATNLDVDLNEHESLGTMSEMLSNHLRRRRRSTKEELSLSSVLPLLLKRPSLNKEQIERVVDFLNKALGFLDEYAEVL